MEFSNKTLAWLVVAAIVVSMTGTILSINSLSMTGMVTSNTSGNASVTISSLTGLTFAVPSLVFGSGSVNDTTSGYNCTMYINNVSNPNIVKSIGCDGFNDTNFGGPLTLENTGNTILNVTLNFSANATNFIGGGGGANPYPQFKFSVANNETGACTTLHNTTWTDVIENVDNAICEGLDYGSSTDSLSIGIFVVIPSNTPQGTKTVTIKAQGTG